MKITALVPIKKESQRLSNKNFLDFNGKPLFQYVLNTLESSSLIDRIIINTDAVEIADYANNHLAKSLIINRPNSLLGNEITMNSLIEFDLTQFKGKHYLQTHVTNPLLTVETIERAITTYFDNLNSHDSLVSVTPIKKRVYDHQLQPINHRNDALLMTQDLPEILVENSNLFLFSHASFSATKSRIGLTPQSFHMNEIESIDIDYLQDFKLAQLIHKNGELFTSPNAIEVTIPANR